MFLELAGMLLMLMIRRTELAEETLEAIRYDKDFLFRLVLILTYFFLSISYGFLTC
jgi:hypothetical protein